MEAVAHSLQSKFNVSDAVIVYHENSFKRTTINKVNFQVDEGGYIVSYSTEYGDLFENTSVILSPNNYYILHHLVGEDCKISGSNGTFKVAEVDGYYFFKLDNVILPISEEAITFI